MHQILSKRICVCLAFLLLVTCTSCKANTPYLVSSYLNDLSIASGIGSSEDINDNYNCLFNWGVVEEKDKELLNEQLDTQFVSKTISKLIDEDEEYLIKNNWLNNRQENVYEPEAKQIIEKAVNHINNKQFVDSIDYEYTSDPIDSNETDLKIGDLIYDKENDEYSIVTAEGIRPATLEEVFSKIEISNSSPVDFSNATVIPYGEQDLDTSYVNNKYNLLANKTHSFNKEGFNISYTLNASGISVHLSKNLDGINIYGDVAINNVKPNFKWSYESGDLKNCYFNLTMNTTEKVGASIGRYGDYYLKFKDLDTNNFKSLLNSMIDPKKDIVEASIPICQIKTPISNLPSVYLNLDLLIKLYVSGKVEVVLYNAHQMGFETKDGQIRYINKHTNDIDSIIRASSKAAVGINIGVDASKYRLFDIELDGGIKAEVKSTMHLYNEDGEFKSVDSGVQYSTLDEIAKENNDVKVCGDVSLYWLLDLIVNTPKSKMYKLGFSKTFHIMDEDNQVFNNMHHIENGQFVPSCTRKKEVGLITTQFENAKNKIVLDSYAEVVLVGDSYDIKVTTIPTGYKLEELVYHSENNEIASVSNGKVNALKPGPAKIKVSTNDNKYSAYINILVSTG